MNQRIRWPAVLLALVALAAAASPASSAEMRFYMKNAGTKGVALEFFSRDRQKSWPGGDKVFLLDPGEKKSIQFLLPVTFDEALTAYSNATAVNSNTVFEWGGDTYIYHQNGVAGVDAGDGLIKLAGAVGLTVGKGNVAADILFAA